MTSFDKREMAFEAKFAHDAETRFMVLSRRNRLLAEWAGNKLGLSGATLADYVHSVLKTEVASAGDAAVCAKITADFSAQRLAVSDADVRHQMDALLAGAVADIDHRSRA